MKGTLMASPLLPLQLLQLGATSGQGEAAGVAQAGPKLWPGHSWEGRPGKGKKASLKPPPNAHIHTPGLEEYERGEPPAPGPLRDVAEPL